MRAIKFVFVALLMISATLKAQTLHVVVFCDTNDQSIGPNKESEKRLTLNEMQTIGNIMDEYGYDTEFIECSGNYCNKKNLIQTVRGLEIGPKDVVFFYYGGHGSRALNDGDPFPQMCLGEDYQENWVPVSLVKNIIAQKNPRLAIILTGCCNKEDAGVSIKSIVSEAPYTKEASINKEAYKQLFLDTKGIVMMTSSKAGQYSYSGKEGGVFCLNFWRYMERVGDSSLKPDWHSLCETVKKAVQETPINTRDGIVYQEPYYQISINENTTSIDPNRNTTRTISVNNQNSTLANDINRLLDQTLSRDQRLGMIDGIKNKHFAPGAKVITVGRNMITNVDYEDAEVFLRRIALSPYIKQINIVSGDGNGQKSQITVHEVRTN